MMVETFPVPKVSALFLNVKIYFIKGRCALDSSNSWIELMVMSIVYI